MANPSFRLDQQTALVTGAASGIGRRIAVGLAEAGADVTCFDLPGPGLAGVAQLSRSLAVEWADRGVRVNAASFCTGVDLLVDAGFSCC